jgi:hypothetical protein
MMVKLGYGRELNTVPVLVVSVWIPMRILKSCFFQCCGSGSVFNGVPGYESGSGSRGAKIESLDVLGGERLLL